MKQTNIFNSLKLIRARHAATAANKTQGRKASSLRCVISLISPVVILRLLLNDDVCRLTGLTGLWICSILPWLSLWLLHKNRLPLIHLLLLRRLTVTVAVLLLIAVVIARCGWGVLRLEVLVLGAATSILEVSTWIRHFCTCFAFLIVEFVFKFENTFRFL